MLFLRSIRNFRSILLELFNVVLIIKLFLGLKRTSKSSLVLVIKLILKEIMVLELMDLTFLDIPKRLGERLSKKAKNYKLFFELDCQDSKLNCLSFLETTNNNYLKIEVVNKLEGEFPKTLYSYKDIKFRQALAQSIYDIPLEQKANYESFLKDKSYATIETVLFNLWRNFPLERKKYLNQTKGIMGFNDKNVRILWLTLALITDDYDAVYKRRYLNELTDYTSPKYNFEIRQNAFLYLDQIEACNETCKSNLRHATTHHNWRFKKFAKELLEKI